jgi:hypothetical protein
LIRQGISTRACKEKEQDTWRKIGEKGRCRERKRGRIREKITVDKKGEKQENEESRSEKSI